MSLEGTNSLPVFKALVPIALALSIIFDGAMGAELSSSAPAVSADLLTFEKAKSRAESGDSAAQAGLGFVFESGSYGQSKDMAQAAFWYRKAAEQGEIFAQTMLAKLYALGEGVPKDFSSAVFWNRKAANKGVAIAQAELGAAYWGGVGVPRDTVQAYMWLNLAAAQGHVLAKKGRDLLEQELTKEQLAEAQRLSAEWKPESIHN